MMPWRYGGAVCRSRRAMTSSRARRLRFSTSRRSSASSASLGSEFSTKAMRCAGSAPRVASIAAKGGLASACSCIQGLRDSTSFAKRPACVTTMYRFGKQSGPKRSCVTYARVSCSAAVTRSFFRTNSNASMPSGASSAVSRRLLTTVSGGSRVSPKPMVSSTVRVPSSEVALRTESWFVTEARESPLSKARRPTRRLARWLLPAPVLPKTMTVHRPVPSDLSTLAAG
mmetsp:Transcript_29621/g.81485  ORF Transcript_29621/g.81485 Transcript_29621/m.81485 type:complete len:228 (+) Transcript_29621:422-1105(+)